jgi:hypothetical protein
MDNYELTYPFRPEALSQLAYFFADHSITPYALNAVRWHTRLTKLVDEWKAAAQESAPRELRLEDAERAGWRILDSRSGSSVVHQWRGR